jgi:biotin carboxyl carrier protein
MTEKKETIPTPVKGKERKRKEKLVKKRNELREREKRKKEKEEKRKEKEKMRKEREERKREREERNKLVKKAKEPKEHAGSPIYVQIFEGGRRYETHSSVKVDMRKPWRKPNPEEICSAIPGSVVSLFVKEGDSVEKGQQVMVYEAMKMHNVIHAPFAGVVQQILVKVGEKLPRGVPMVVIRSTETEDTCEVAQGVLNFEEF